MLIEYMDQYSPEWFAARIGRPSASKFNQIVTSTGKASTQAKKYMYSLVGELLLGEKVETYQNANMLRGLELEGEAIQLYEMMYGVEVQAVGICYKNEQKTISCSPDGLVGDDGLLEVKCPTLPVHVEYLINNKVPTAYIQQTQGQLFVTGRKWVDFLSYYPGLTPLIARSYRDEAFMPKLSKALLAFDRELKSVYAKLKEKI
jgi:hypothetical protein